MTKAEAERKAHIALVKRLRDNAEVARIGKEIAEALLLLGRPATADEIAEIVNAHRDELGTMLGVLVHMGTLECNATPRTRSNRARKYTPAKYGFARQAEPTHAHV